MAGRVDRDADRTRQPHRRSGATLIQIADAEVAAQAREADANAAQIEARLGTASGAAFDVERVPEVANARANYELAQTEFERTKMLQESQLISRSEFDQKAGAGRGGAASVRSRAERRRAAVSGADGRKGARGDGPQGRRRHCRPRAVRRRRRRASRLGRRLRHARHQGRLGAARQPAAPRADRAGAVRHRSGGGRRGQPRGRCVSRRDIRRPGALRLARRSAPTRGRSSSKPSSPTPTARLKPGLFATARIEQAAKSPALLVPATAVQKTAAAARVFVVVGDHVEERLITLGQVEGEQVEAATGLKAGERVVATGLERLKDGALREGRELTPCSGSPNSASSARSSPGS